MLKTKEAIKKYNDNFVHTYESIKLLARAVFSGRFNFFMKLIWNMENGIISYYKVRAALIKLLSRFIYCFEANFETLEYSIGETSNLSCLQDVLPIEGKHIWHLSNPLSPGVLLGAIR